MNRIVFSKFAISFFMFLSLLRPLCAADVRLEDTSLALVPKTAATYSANFLVREQIQRFTNSNAVKRLLENQFVQMGMGQVKFMFQNALNEGPFAEFLEVPENKQLVKLLGDAFSQEIFIYANEDSADALRVMLSISNEINAIQMEFAATGESPEGEEFAERMVEKILDSFDADKIPGGVFGLKTSKPEDVKGQLKRLEDFMSTAIENQEELKVLKGRFNAEQINGNRFLTLRIDEKMVPWDQVDNIPEDLVKKIRDKLAGAEIMVTLGLHKDYLLLGIAKDTSVIEKFGSGPSLLERDEMAPLRKAGAKPYASVAYASEEMMQKLGTARQIVEQYTRMAEGFLLNFEKIPDDLKEELKVDFADLRSDVEAETKKTAGAVMQYSYMVPQGYEGYSYNWAKNPLLDGSKPLSILQQVGKTPLFVVAGRNKQDPVAQRLATKWIGRAFYYFDRVVRIQIDDEEDLETYSKAVKEFKPIFKKLEEINREKLIPAFADGQSAFVLDAKIKLKSWHIAQPPADEPLPMFEPAMVCGVSDRNLALEGFKELFKIADLALEKAKELSTRENEIPIESIPRPDETSVAGETMYSYALPPNAGIDSEVIKPNAVLTDHFFYLSLMPETTTRLMNKEALDVKGRILSDVNRPFCAIAHMDFGGIMDVIGEWVDYGMEMTGTDKEPFEIFLDFIACFKGFSTATYLENDVTVSHFEVRFEDLK